jgi:DNA-directed RNA polymerase subunit RPC12/RpoP
MAERRCLHCGMSVTALRFDLDEAPPRLKCPKCDRNLYLQHDGRLLTRDIAHGHETVARALEKLDAALLESWRGYCRGVRLVVGGGRIRDEVLGQLRYYRERGIVREYREDSRNRGAIVVTLRD